MYEFPFITDSIAFVVPFAVGRVEDPETLRISGENNSENWHGHWYKGQKLNMSLLMMIPKTELVVEGCTLLGHYSTRMSMVNF